MTSLPIAEAEAFLCLHSTSDMAFMKDPNDCPVARHCCHAFVLILFHMTTSSSWTLAWLRVSSSPDFLAPHPRLLSLLLATLNVGAAGGFGLRLCHPPSTPSPWVIAPVPRD